MATKTSKIKKKKNVSLNDLALMMGRGFNEVHEKIDKGFAAVDERFEHIDERFGRIDERLESIDGRFEHIDERFGRVDEDIAELKRNFNTLQTAVDGYAKKADTYFQEMVMLAHKVDRMERWILQLAKKAGIQLEA